LIAVEIVFVMRNYEDFPLRRGEYRKLHTTGIGAGLFSKELNDAESRR